jgi:hypothetical protein
VHRLHERRDVIYVDGSVEVRKPCIDCAANPPETNTEQTLVSKLGWRVSRIKRDNQTILEWRCPECWRKHKAAFPSGMYSATKPPERS